MSLAPKTKPDLFIIRGDSYSIAFNVDVDLTGTTVFFTAKPTIANEATDTTAVISVEVTAHDDAVAGETTIPLSATDTDVTPGDYYYDIQIKDGTTITSIGVRKLRVYGDITRRTA